VYTAPVLDDGDVFAKGRAAGGDGASRARTDAGSEPGARKSAPDVSHPDADDERSSPFRALLAAAIEHEEAAVGLAAAYAELDVEDRKRLIEAIVADARIEGLSIGPVLAQLCTVEDEPSLIATIGRCMSVAGIPVRASRKPCRILLGGDALRGAAMLVRPATRGFAEALSLRWSITAGIVHAASEQFDCEEALRERARNLTAEYPLEPSPLDFGAEVVATALWQHRRLHGTLPEAARDFADLLGPHAEHPEGQIEPEPEPEA